VGEKENIKKIDTESFSCPNCGGAVAFSIQEQVFKCTSCGTEVDPEIEQTQIKEYDFASYRQREASNQVLDHLALAVCSSCGSEVFFEEHDTATLCPMCGSTHVSEARQLSGIPPEGLIAFRIDKKDAEQKFEKWVKTRWFAPNALKKSYGEGNLQGMYIPFWTYDVDAYARYTGRGGRHYTERTKDGKTVVKTRWYPVAGHVAEFFDDIQICASKSSESAVIEGVLPYNTIHGTIPFSTQYLAGFKAEKYSIKADEGFERAKSKVQQELHSRAHSDILMKGYNTADSIRLNIQYKEIKYKHVLLPVWSAVFGFNGKTYRYVINGETGRVSGQRPYSAIKITIAVIIGILIALGIFYFSEDGEMNFSQNQGYSYAREYNGQNDLVYAQIEGVEKQ
jgi:predicted RNA-binding Zn-ribbon protein involved in translation (DUF1610 family)